MQRYIEENLPVYHGSPWAPYFVFLKRTDLEDAELLNRFGKASYKPSVKNDVTAEYLAIGRDSDWIHIADNFSYSHWHSKEFRSPVKELTKESDVFIFSVGDTDMSFEFAFFSDGKLIRSVVWEDPEMDGGFLKKQKGNPLNSEQAIPRGKDPLKGLWALAAEQGINTDFEKVKLRVYSSPGAESL